MLVSAILNVVRGFAMGAADIVPGVSGGTIALLLGIYERLIGSVRAGSKGLGFLIKADVATFRTWMAKVEWLFILALGAGILLAILSLASLLRQGLEDEPELMAAIFMGLVAGSVVVAWRLIRAPRINHAVIIVGMALLTFLLLGLTGGTSEDSVTQSADPQLWAFFVAGAIAISAMILPGVSGSFLLVVMGMYAPLLTAVTERDAVTLGVFLAGAVVGLALFSQVLYVALQRHHDLMLAVLIGLMAGSMRVLWPWPNGVESTTLELPQGGVLVALAAATVAFVVVVVVGRFAQGFETREEERLDPSASSPGTATEAP